MRAIVHEQVEGFPQNRNELRSNFGRHEIEEEEVVCRMMAFLS